MKYERKYEDGESFFSVQLKSGKRARLPKCFCSLEINQLAKEFDMTRSVWGRMSSIVYYYLFDPMNNEYELHWRETPRLVSAFSQIQASTVLRHSGVGKKTFNEIYDVMTELREIYGETQGFDSTFLTSAKALKGEEPNSLKNLEKAVKLLLENGYSVEAPKAEATDD